MNNLPSSNLQQIHPGVGPRGYQPVAHYKTKDTTYAREYEELQTRLLTICPPSLWPRCSYRNACPRPILVSNHHQQGIVTLHEALAAAITDIVGRWWTDHEARFPDRMPLEGEEEDLLQASLLHLIPLLPNNSL